MVEKGMKRVRQALPWLQTPDSMVHSCCLGLDWKKMHSLEVEFLGLQAWEAASPIALRDCSKGWGGTRIYRSFCNKDQVVETQKVTVNERIRYLKLSNLALFCLWEEAWVQAPWNHSFDMHLGYLLPVSILSLSLSPLRVHCWGWPRCPRYLAVGSPVPLPSIQGFCSGWWLQHPLSTKHSWQYFSLTI